MFKSLNIRIPKKYHVNFNKEKYDKKKRPKSKKLNNIKVINHNKQSTNIMNNFGNTNSRFYVPLNNENDFINRYIKNDQHYNNLKNELLNNKVNEKIKFIRQGKDKDIEQNIKYKLKSQEMKNPYKTNGFILDSYNVNEMPKKLYEFNNIEDPQMIMNRNFEQKRENKRYDENNYNKDETLNMNNIMIKESNNLKEDDKFLHELLEIKTNKNKKKFYNLKINKDQKIEIQAVNKNSKNLNEIEKELKKRENEIEEREKEFNNKINFLEDKENMLEKEFKEHENIKKENIYLNQRNVELENKIKEKENINIQFQNLMNANNEENKNVKQENLILKEKIKKLEEEIAKLKKNNNNNKQPKLKLKDLSVLYKKPTLIGLNNIGATCFMNSTLQCLSQTKPLTNYFIINKEKIKNIILENKNECQLSPVYLELIEKLWDKEERTKSFSPYNFMNTIEKINPLFKAGQAGDAKDFIIFILEQLHKELKKPINFGNNIGNIVLDQYDKQNAFNFFLNEFKNNCSIISDLFFGFNETTNECLNCKNIYNSKGSNNPICYNYGIFNCLIFPLEEVKNMKNNSFKNNDIQINNNIVSLLDCFYYNQKTELFTDQNKNYCNVCKQLYDSIYTSKIFVSPTVLVIILNRGRGNIYDVKLDFSETIDITQFVLKKDRPQLIYNLYGVITHIGQSGPNAHFVASCKSPIDNQWYRYNDAMVNLITNINNEIINFGVPYILFYQKM